MAAYRVPARFTALMVVSLAAWGVCAQNETIIRRSASLVLVPVSALDKSGKFVPDLTAHDFQILVDGKHVEIASFDAVNESSPPSPGTITALPPNTFRNISQFSANQPNLAIFFVDYLNTRLADRMRLREELLKYLANQLKPDEEIAAYGLTERLVILQPFTRDPSQLIAFARTLLQQKGQPPDPKISEPLVKPGMDPRQITELEKKSQKRGTDAAMELLSARNARVAYNMDQLDRAARTLAAFRELAESFGGISGKKTVIWLTGDASPLNPTLLYRNPLSDKAVETPETSWWQMAKTYEALNAAGVSIFPVDIRGVINTGLAPLEGFRTHEEFRESVGGTQPSDMSPYSGPTSFRQGEAANAVLAMDSVASETGGTVLAGSNDIGELLGRAHKIWANYYVLSFVPEKPAHEAMPSYHRIRVNVDHKGVQILARRGYVSRSETLLSADTEIQRDLAEAAISPVDLSSVGLQLALREWKGGDRIRHYPFSIKVSSALLGTPSAKGAPYDLSIAILVRDQDGKFGTPVGKRVRGTVPQAAISTVTANGMEYDAEFATPAGAPQFGRVIVRDNLTGRIGTITLMLPTTVGAAQ